MTAHRLAVVGSRACSPAQFSAVMRVLDREAGDATIVTGDAAGVDEAARFWARHCVGRGLLWSTWQIGPPTETRQDRSAMPLW